MGRVAVKVKDKTEIEKEVPNIPIGYHEIVGLPSKKSVISRGHENLFKATRYFWKSKKLATIDSDNANDVINSVLTKTVIGIEVKDLLVADKLFYNLLAKSQHISG